LDYGIDHYLNHVVRAHHLLVSVIDGFSNWGVTAFGVAACVIWLFAAPGGDDRWKRACAAGLAAASLGLLANQVIAHLWDRPRPYQAHHNIVPLLTPSHDPSFPSDHATAAFAIAFGVLFVYRRAGYVFLAAAAVIAASRVLAGMHYPSDVLAGAAIGLASGYLTARVAMRPLLLPLIALVSRATDPLVAVGRRTWLVRRTLLNPAVRARIVLLVGVALLVVFTADLRAHLLDEMELAVLGTWALIIAAATRLAAGRGLRLWPR
jgi:undecaprenyl-diphosphatase